MKESLNSSTIQAGACFLAPLALVGALFVARDAPVTEIDPAGDIDEEFVAEDMKIPRVVKRGALTGDRAREHADEAARLAALAPFASPFVDKTRYQFEPEPSDLASGGPEVEGPVFKLTSVMAAPGGELCVINQRVRRAGDDLGGGWRVKAIDAAARSVTIAGPGGRETVLSQR